MDQMNFYLPEEQLAVQEMVRNFTEKKLKPGVIDRDEKGEFSLELFSEMGKMGLFGLAYPEEFGGQGKGSYLSYAVAVEEISKVDSSMGIAFSVLVSLYGGSVMNSPRMTKPRKSSWPLSSLATTSVLSASPSPLLVLMPLASAPSL